MSTSAAIADSLLRRAFGRQVSANLLVRRSASKGGKELGYAPEAVRKGLFLRFYGHEFDAESRAKILAAIESATHPVTS